MKNAMLKNFYIFSMPYMEINGELCAVINIIRL